MLHEMKKFILEFSEEQLVTLNEALIEMPFKKALPIINHINSETQKSFNHAVDEKDMPTKQTMPKDQFAGD